MVAEQPMVATHLTAALCKKSNRVARVLAYALLEWILIALLLANGVFSYLISKFAAFFGLAPPCVLCSRLGVDSLFEPHRGGGGAEPLRRVLCDAHAAEVSRLGYCRAHRRLADAGDMCEDCAAASATGKALSWMRRSELGERDLVCACCGVALESGFYSPSLLPGLLSPALVGGYKGEGMGSPNGDVVFVPEEGPVLELFDGKPLVQDDSIGVIAQCDQIVGGGGRHKRLVPLESIDLLAACLVGVSSQSGGDGKEEVDHGMVERDSAALDITVSANEELVVTSDDEKVDDVVNRMIDEEISASVVSSACVEEMVNGEINTVETKEGFADRQTLEEDIKLKDNDFCQEISEDEHVEQADLTEELVSTPAAPWEHVAETLNGNTEEELFEQAELKQEWDSTAIDATRHAPETLNENAEDEQVGLAELKQELFSTPINTREHVAESLGRNTEEKQVEQAELKQEQDSISMNAGVHIPETLNQNEEKQELKQASVVMRMGVLTHVTDTLDANTTTGKDDIEVDQTEDALPSLHRILPEPAEITLTSLDILSPENNDFKEERGLDTPTHIEDISDLQEFSNSKTKTSDTKSVDSSVATMSTELESSELVTVDQMKSALVAARKSLNALYAELENERNAAAIAADETMAMINRLQEQKAAMQMEAIQYQRLMEEQSEYDQEALQKLNELVVKREKEKQDLERELELCRHKVHLFEAKERRKMSRYKADDQNGSSSASSSAEYSDDLSQSFYEGDESGHNGSNGSIPTDVVLQETARHLVTLDNSLAGFEEERLSILEQLKLLEERLFDLEDEESDNVKTDEHFLEENHLSSALNGFSDEDSACKLGNRRENTSYRGKKLLPLFDDATVENGNGLLTKSGAQADDSTEVALELVKEQDKLAIENEIDQLHERLYALESDRECLKQCVRSLNKGGKGLDLLQEILYHLRDLRRIEQRARNSGDLSPHYLHPYTD